MRPYVSDALNRLTDVPQLQPAQALIYGHNSMPWPALLLVGGKFISFGGWFFGVPFLLGVFTPVY